LQLIKSIAITPEKGAETLVYLASSSDVARTSGFYFAGCRKVTPRQMAQDDAAAGHLCELSTQLTDISVAR